MSVDAATVRRIAHLARIAVEDDEVEHLEGELNAILAFVEQLSEVDVTGVAPMTSVTPMTMKMRQDAVTDGEIPDLVVRNAPAGNPSLFCRFGSASWLQPKRTAVGALISSDHTSTVSAAWPCSAGGTILALAATIRSSSPTSKNCKTSRKASTFLSLEPKT